MDALAVGDVTEKVEALLYGKHKTWFKEGVTQTMSIMFVQVKK